MKTVHGLEPLKVSAHEIQIEAGIAANSSDDAYMEVPRGPVGGRRIDIRRVGPWGLDRALELGWWHLWLIQRSDTKESAAMLSFSELGGGVILPDGWDRIRKMPAAWRIVGSSAGMQDQVLVSWHSPTEFLYQASDHTYEIDFGGTSGAWSRKTLQPLIPKNARLAILDIVVTGADVALVRTPGKGDGGPGIGPGQAARREIAVSSTGEIEVRTSNNTQARVRVQGFRTQETY